MTSLSRPGALSRLQLLALSGLALAGLALASQPCVAQSAASGDGLYLPNGLETPLPGERLPEWNDEPSYEVPTLHSFPKEVGESFLGLFDAHNLAPLFVGVTATATARAFDVDPKVEGFMSHTSKITGFGSAGDAFGSTKHLAPAVGALFMAGRFGVGDERFQSFTWSLAEGWLLTRGVTTGLKLSTRRARPNGKDSLSFPSGHTAEAFTIASLLDQYYGKKVGWPAYLAASYVGMSRLDGNDHHVSDVIAGATLGYIVGHTVARRHIKDGDHPFLTFAPTVGPKGGVGIAAHIEF